MTLKLQHRGSVSHAVESTVPELVAQRIASRLLAKDSSIWGPAASSEASIRLGWVDAAAKTKNLLPDIEELAKCLRSSGITRVVLCGMGGSSLAPEVIVANSSVDLVVLDSTDPLQVATALDGDLDRTVVVVSSKSGSTVETDSQKRSFEARFEAEGIDRTQRIIVVTDPDSPMHKQALIDGYRVFLADPNVGGRYSALTAFGAVPSVLAGVDMNPILNSAITAGETLFSDQESNPALILGSAMARTASPDGFKDKLGLVAEAGSLVGFGDWAEQLIAESTGKIGRGVLPIVLNSNAPETSIEIEDLLLIGLCGDVSDSSFDLAVSGELGEQFLLWEVATAVACFLLGVNPFDQPDVEAAKNAARAQLDSPRPSSKFDLDDSGIGLEAFGLLLDGADTAAAIDRLFASANSSSYFAIHCYLDRGSFSKAARLRDLIALNTRRPTTFGWGPRFLHSTGQYHKGGPKQGLFLQIMSGSSQDEAIPGRDFGYRQLIDSQATGDANVLADSGYSVLRLRLDDPSSGIDRLIGLLS
jgi:glucose-6-phosphate isomerase